MPAKVSSQTKGNFSDDLIVIATALGDTVFANKWADRRQTLAAEYHAGFFEAGTGTYDAGTMTSLTLPLHLGVTPKSELPRVKKNLLAKIAAAGTHSYAGIIGAKYLFPVLSSMGRKDTALAILENVDYPSLGFEAYNKYEKSSENLWELLDDLPRQRTGAGRRSGVHWPR